MGFRSATYSQMAEEKISLYFTFHLLLSKFEIISELKKFKELPLDNEKERDTHTHRLYQVMTRMRRNWNINTLLIG